MPRDAFEGYDEPVNIDMDPEEGLKVLLQIEPKCAEEDQDGDS